MYDAWQLEHSTDDPAAIRAYDEFLDHYARGTPHVLEQIQQLQTLAPDLPSGKFGYWYLRLLSGRGFQFAQVHAEATDYAQSRPMLCAREESHLAAVLAWSSDQTARAAEHWQHALAAAPHDLLAAKLAQFALFYLGAAQQMARSGADALNAWPEDSPLLGYMQGVAAFGYEEIGEYDIAQALGRAAVAAHPDDLWAAHAVSHCLYMLKQFDDGQQWTRTALEHTPDYGMQNHVRWHLGLHQLALGDTESVVQEQASGSYGAGSDEYMDLCNDISLLQRLELQGVDCAAHWPALAQRVLTRASDQTLIFADCHYVLALAAANHPALPELLARVSAVSEQPGDNARATRLVGAAVCAGLVAFRQGDVEQARQLLHETADQLHLLGGSNAQRQLFLQVRDHALQASMG